MKRIALLISSLRKLGGLERSALAIASGFSQRGYTVDLLSQGETSPLIQKSPFPISLGKVTPNSWINHLLFESRCKQHLKNNGYEIIFGLERSTMHTHYRAGNGVHAIFLERRTFYEKRWKRKLLSFDPRHHSLLQREFRTFRSPLLRMIITNSAMVQREIEERFTPTVPLHVIHNGCDWANASLHFASWRKARECFLSQEKLNPSIPQLLFAGDGFHRKGLLFLLHTLKFIEKEPWHLHVVGKESNLSPFEREMDKLGLRGRISFWGHSKNLHLFYQVADLFILPSWYDPFANTTLEALSMGVFTVTSTYNGAHEIIQRGSGATIDLHKDVADSAAILQAHLRLKDDDTAAKIRESVSHLTWERQLATLIDLSEGYSR